MSICKSCGNNTKNKLYCSNKCQQNFQYESFIAKWLAGEDVERRSINGGVSNHIRKYLREKYDNKCMNCGWGELNMFSNSIPLEIDHIDGHYKNSKIENLRLLCPNCHSLTPNYGILNRGKGRRYARIKYRDELGLRPYSNGKETSSTH